VLEPAEGHGGRATRTLFIAWLWAFPGLALAAEGNFRFGLNMVAGYDSNVANAEHQPDIRNSLFGNLEFQVDYTRPLFATVLATARAMAAEQGYSRYGQLSNGKAGGMLRLTWRPAGAFFAPELSAWGSAAYWKFGSYIRTSDDYRYGVSALEDLTTRIDLRLNLNGTRRIANTRVFTQSSQAVGLNLDWEPSRALTVSAGSSFQYGDVESSGTPNASIIRVATVIEPDDAFGGINADEYAYKLRAHTLGDSFNLRYNFSPFATVEAQTEYADARAPFDNRYTRWISAVSLLLRF
jgi:hypothetical protein